MLLKTTLTKVQIDVLLSAQEIINNADFALKQLKGTQYAYYTKEGFAVLDDMDELKSVGFLDEGGKLLYSEVMHNAKNG